MLPGATTKTPRGSSPALAAGKRWSEAPVVQPGAMGGHGGVRGRLWRGCFWRRQARDVGLRGRRSWGDVADLEGLGPRGVMSEAGQGR